MASEGIGLSRSQALDRSPNAPTSSVGAHATTHGPDDLSLASQTTQTREKGGGVVATNQAKEPVSEKRTNARKAPKKMSSVGSRNSFFSLLSHYKPSPEIGDQRSPGPVLGHQFHSPEQLEDSEGMGDDSQQRENSPSSTKTASISTTASINRNSPLQWLARMGVAERDGNSVIAIKRPSIGGSGSESLSHLNSSSIVMATHSPRLSSPKRKLAITSTPKKNEKSRGGNEKSRGVIDKVELERLKKRSLAHFDTQSMAFNLGELVSQGKVSDVKLQKITGASAAAKGTTGDIFDEGDKGDGVGNEIAAPCPFFRNEIGNVAMGPSLVAQAAHHRRVRVSMAAHETIMEENQIEEKNSKEEGVLSPGLKRDDVAMSPLVPDEVVPKEIPTGLGDFEFVDQGAIYYRKYFYGQDHQNYTGIDENLGPIAVSLRREPMAADSGREKFQYRIIVRTSDLIVLRGSIPEDSIPTSTKPGSRGLPAKDVLEFVAGELQLSCLRLAQTGKVPERLMQLDEEGLSARYRIGVMYCKAGQTSEDEMYGNETGSEEFDHFLTLLGEKIVLKGFQAYRAQLDTKGDSTGTHSVFTSFHDLEIMFHVSTLLPFTRNNNQQVLRKRHIGNDIVTIIFQEPGSQPFSPRMIRSNFQHIFIIVRLLTSTSPRGERPQYSIAVSRSVGIPFFGPEIPSGGTFSHGSGFREFILTKALNGENAAKKSAKFADMARRTRKEYLLDLAKSYSTSQTLDSAFGLYGKLFSRAVRRRDKNKPYLTLETAVKGAITWHVLVEGGDFSSRQQSISCVLGISVDSFVLVDESTKQTIFSIPSKTVIGWTTREFSLKLYYDVGEFVTVKLPRDGGGESCGDIQEIVKRLAAVTSGCEAQEMQLRKTTSSGQLGFVLHGQGLVGEVDEFSYVYTAGLRKGSRLVEIGDMPVHDMEYDNLVQLLQIAGSVHVIVIPPLVDGQARGTRLRRQLSWSSLFTPSVTPELIHRVASSEEKDPKEEKVLMKLPNTIPRHVTTSNSTTKRPASADRIRRKPRHIKSRSAGSLSDTSWFKENKSGESSTSTSRTPYESSDSDDNFIEERSVPVAAEEEEEEEEEKDSSSTSESSSCGELVLVPNREAEDDDVESSDAEANFDRRIGSIVETANRLADEKAREEEEARTRTLEREREKPAEKTVVSSSTLPTPTRPRVKNLELLNQDTTGAGEQRQRSVADLVSLSPNKTVAVRRHSASSKETTATTPLEDAFRRIAYLEDHVRKLTEDLYNVRDENAQLRHDLEAERLENSNLRQRGEGGSESHYFSDWYNEQQMTSDL